MRLLDSLRNVYRWSLSGSTYDAVHAKNKRSAPTGILRSEDAELSPADRRKMLSGARTLHRNFAVAAWMIRKHLDYVSTFSFQARTQNDALDDTLERLVRWWSQPGNFEVTGRFSRQKFCRLAEMRRTVDQGLWVGAELVEIRASAGLEGGVQFRIRQGVRGLLCRGEAYLIVEPASHYYRVMTRSDRMPVLIGERIQPEGPFPHRRARN